MSSSYYDSGRHCGNGHLCRPSGGINQRVWGYRAPPEDSDTDNSVGIHIFLSVVNLDAHFDQRATIISQTGCPNSPYSSARYSTLEITAILFCAGYPAAMRDEVSGSSFANICRVSMPPYRMRKTNSSAERDL